MSMDKVRQMIADRIWPEGRDRRNEAERLANTDCLTGLANRRAFELAMPSASGDPKMLVGVLDLDGFKEINDSFGHDRGDKVLRAFAEVLRVACTVYNSRAFRWGGDEFVVLATRLAAPLIERRLRAGLPRHVGKIPFGVTIVFARTFAEADSLLAKEKERRRCERTT